jgi:hypothetical protein
VYSTDATAPADVYVQVCWARSAQGQGYDEGGVRAARAARGWSCTGCRALMAWRPCRSSSKHVRLEPTSGVKKLDLVP